MILSNICRAKLCFVLDYMFPAWGNFIHFWGHWSQGWSDFEEWRLVWDLTGS